MLLYNTIVTEAGVNEKLREAVVIADGYKKY